MVWLPPPEVNHGEYYVLGGEYYSVTSSCSVINQETDAVDDGNWLSKVNSNSSYTLSDGTILEANKSQLVTISPNTNIADISGLYRLEVIQDGGYD